MPFVLVQNDYSVYGDVEGEVYEYPTMYSPVPGERFVYYRGRESGGPHYFGTGVLGDVDKSSTPGLLEIEILDYQAFSTPVGFKYTNGEYVEDVVHSNHWRRAVRPISQKVFDSIIWNAERNGFDGLEEDEQDSLEEDEETESVDLDQLLATWREFELSKLDDEFYAGYASAAKRKAVEEISVEIVMGLVEEWFPGEPVEEMAHNNPGFDIRVGTPGDEVAFVEVKGTSTTAPGFHISEREIQFSIENSDQYIFVIVTGIDIEARTYQRYVRRDGSVEAPGFHLVPRQWRGLVVE
jgi:hypothetical protein